jgi:hypothetical protein
VPNRIADRLKSERRRLFVGRTAEKELFTAALTHADPPFFVLYVYGPGGVGKTTLLHELVLDARELGADATYLDLRNVEATPDAFAAGLAVALGGSPQQNPVDLLHGRSQRSVLLLDTWENLAALESWLRESFLPELPATALTVIASRSAPSTAWTTDPGWKSLLRVVPLRNLSPDESMDYLNLRTVPLLERSGIVGFTHGHPLAISLVADVLDQQPGYHFEPLAVPNIIESLLGRLIHDAPSRLHRATLEAACLALYMTESLLAAMLELDDAHGYFEWLRSLSFMEAGRYGLFPHDLVRETMATDLRWRNPDWYVELHRRARSFYHARLRQTTGFNQRRVLAELIFLHRDASAVRAIFNFQVNDNLFTDRLRPSDAAALVAMVEHHEGPESARLMAFWCERQPATILVIRDQFQSPVGFVTILLLQAAAPEDVMHDPATRVAWQFVQRQPPLREGEQVLYFRFWMEHVTYQALSTAQSRIFLNIIQYYLITPGLAYSFFPCADPQFYADVLAYADIQRTPELDFVVDSKYYGIFFHDWRLRPATTWLDLLAEHEIAYSAESGSPPRPAVQPPTLFLLSEAEFAQAVRDALRHYTRLDELQANPLVRARLVLAQAGAEANSAARTRALHALVTEAVDLLRSSPRQQKLYRALYHTYIQPASTQELAAELLDLPFSTYRRHLKEGIENVVANLWARELGAEDP